MKAAAKRTWAFVWDAIDRFNRNDGSAMAGYIAFTCLLSIFPFLIFATTLIGVLVGPSRTDEITHALFELAPPHVAMTLEPVVEEVLGKQSERILTLSAIFAIWVASNAIEAFRTAFDRAYAVRAPRHIITNRAIAILFVFIGAFVALILGFSIVLSPLLIRLLQDFAHLELPGITSYLTYLFGVIVFIVFLRLMHRYLPHRRMKLAVIWPGVMVTTVLWVLGALAFSVYLSWTPTYSITYGALAGVIITLLFFYLTGAVIIFGAEVNASLNGVGRGGMRIGRAPRETALRESPAREAGE
jgi:membrane protein